MLDAEVLREYVGGDLEVQYFDGRPGGLPDTVHRGPVTEFVNAGAVVAKLEWCGEMKPKSKTVRWVAKPEVTQVILPFLMEVPSPDNQGRLILISEEGVMTLFPPNGKKLERDKVEGLE